MHRFFILFPIINFYSDYLEHKVALHVFLDLKIHFMIFLNVVTWLSLFKIFCLILSSWFKKYVPFFFFILICYNFFLGITLFLLLYHSNFGNIPFSTWGNKWLFPFLFFLSVFFFSPCHFSTSLCFDINLSWELRLVLVFINPASHPPDRESIRKARYSLGNV